MGKTQRIILTFVLIHFLSFGILHAQSSTPTVNGLFFGDSDNTLYQEYGVSEYGSKLYIYNASSKLYVALVVTRDVNDNVFSPGTGQNSDRDYTTSAGWSPPRDFGALANSEFAEFTLVCGVNSYNWQQGYVGASDGTFENTEADWISDETVAGGTGTPPPSSISSSSLAYNMNAYANNSSPAWDMNALGSSSSQWKSPFDTSDPSNVIGLDGYPATGPITFSSVFEWEWPMVYEWSVDLDQACGADAITVLTGRSHHSPSKNDDENDDFPPDSDPEELKDWGDLPSSDYPTVSADNGANHIILASGNSFLGTIVDAEPNGLPNADSDGDDASGNDDEDGITFLTPFVPGGTADIEVVVGKDGYLSAFIDFNSDGILETVELSNGDDFSDFLLAAGTHTLTISVPSDATGLMYARFRITNNSGEGGSSPDGEAQSGEVEDYNSLAALGDFVWQDFDNDGIQDSGEPGLEGVVVNLLDGNGDPVEDADGNPLTTTTDGNGFYEFPGLLPGSYQVEFEEPDNFVFTEKNEGGDDDKDSDADKTNGLTQVVTLSAGEVNHSLDAGLVELLTLTLTQQQCFRTLSSPFKNKTYNDIVGDLWTQGVVGSDNIGAGFAESNIFVWSNDQPDNDPAGWIAPGSAADGLNDGIPEGSGFLMSIFEDDNADGTIDPDEEFPKELILTGTQYAANETVTPVMNENDDGWTLVGNPFGDDIDFGFIVDNNFTTDLTDVAYVYNINGSGTTDDSKGNPVPGGWMTTDGVNGDLFDGKIAIFQSFFVQTDGSSPQIEFTNDARTTGAAFYGKEKIRKDFVRLQLENTSVVNSAWITFSESGQTNRMKGDAFELVPFTENYTLMGTTKDNEVFDIGQFPDQNGLEIPLHVETTESSQFTLKATDLQLSSEKKLMFTDREKNITLPLNESFEYTFTIEQTVSKRESNDLFSCGSVHQMLKKSFEPQKAKTNSSINNRFIISLASESEVDAFNELPSSVALKQNFPNPFNPTTQISYELPQQTNVRLEVYDLVGRQIATLVDQTVEAGAHTISFDAGNLSSGVYIYRLNAGNTVLSRKLTVIK